MAAGFVRNNGTQSMTNPRADVDFLSVRVARFLMKVVGFWAPKDKREETLLTVLMVYTIWIVSMSLYIETFDFFMSVGDFYAVTYATCSAMPIVIIMAKVITCFRHQDELIGLIRYAEENFWYREYDSAGKNIMTKTNQKASMLICYFTFFVQVTCFTYALTPIIENVGKNETDRILPFQTWFFNKDVRLTPYFEILFTLEGLALIHAGLCFCCFDNLVCLLNLSVAAQFQVLQRRIETIYDRHYVALKESCDEESRLESVCRELEDCVMEHKKLISYMDSLEAVFAFLVLCQLLASSIMLCVAGFQVFLLRGQLLRRLIFFAHTNGSLFQIFVVTFSSDEVMEQSVGISRAAYMTGWQLSSYEKHGKIRHNLRMIMRRAERPCCLSAGHFFPVNLETFKSVLSAAASYFTLLRKVLEENQL